ncbi:GLPGLI family protein [Chryseobacterium taichungense]|uniref:GLPGLI family protein n=1 Tax=Chryseobacterium taichungense TaxID=295069 RepID=A0A1H7ZMS4_9FLAO|nr:GLPGLI family protein [Chryseobacterium taichungense]SEM59635.1 GLPGLI family protein [Chryseobacterium taichungense]
MNRILPVFIFLIICTSLNSQTMRFLYNYQFKSDSLHREKQASETMALDVSPENGSEFYSYKKYQQDSISKSGGNSTYETVDRAKVKFFVTKKYPDYASVLYTSIGPTAVNMSSNKKLEWNILPDKDSLEGYPVQKAILNFQGRRWTAWFTPEIQIQDGPYRFYGLPGLILKIEDQKADHIFTLIGIKKMGTEKISTSNFINRKSIEVNEQQFSKLWKNHKKDPARDYRMKYSGPSSGGNLNVGGQIISKREIIKKYEEQALEKIKSENNFIELEMYK